MGIEVRQVSVKRLKKVLFLPDTHSPYHCKPAFDLVEKVVAGIGPFDEVVIEGDFPDFYSVSTHSKDPKRAGKFFEEVEVTKQLLRRVEGWGFTKQHYVMGNHEDRLDRYIHDKAPEMKGIVSCDGLLELTRHRWHITPYKDHTMVGKVYVTHDVGKAGPSAVKDALSSYQDNVVIGHLHRISYMVEGNAKGVPHVAACFGWLGDVAQVDYMYRVKANRDWALGFGVGYVRDNGFVYLQPVPIIDGSCCVEGKLFAVSNKKV